MISRKWLLLPIVFAALTDHAVGCDKTAPQIAFEVLVGGRYFSIPSASMWPTLKVGARIFASVLKSDQINALNRGDLVVFCTKRAPEAAYVKRIIGLPGDKIEIRSNHILINGSEIERHQIANGELDGRKDIPCFEESVIGAHWRVCQLEGNAGQAANRPEITLPPGEFYVLGDNRDNSLDSRYPNEFGRVLTQDLIGIMTWSR